MPITLFPNNTFTLADSPQLNAFGRLRVAEPRALFDNTGQYGNNTFFWETAVVGTGAVSVVANNCAVRLSTGGTADTASAIRQTQQYRTLTGTGTINAAISWREQY